MAAVIRKSIKISGACLFMVYMVLLIYFLFFSEEYGRGAAEMVYDYNISPFREIRRFLTYRDILGFRAVFLNLAGNIIGFMPFGALLPVMAKSARKGWKVTLLSFEVSALIEISQLFFRVGCFDVDDIILNTLGGLLGYAVFWLCSRCYLWLERR
ncbi:MAG TPA: VanZ family protein [Candidatus Choladousia intestinipullorum]|nr:VanZ family protein [Candidatus Choladousia intestinipullorum]